MSENWWHRLYLGPESAWLERHCWLSTGTYWYELKPRRPGKFVWHNRLVEEINYPSWPRQHAIARRLADTTLARQCDVDPETGLSKCATGLLLLASHIEGRDVRCRVMQGCGAYLAFHADDVTGPRAEDTVGRVLEILRLLDARLGRSSGTIAALEPESRIYR